MIRHQIRARAIPAGAALALFFLCSLPAAAESSLPALVKRVQPSIVTVIGYGADGQPQQLGTGFFVDRRGHLVTNRHVLAGAMRAEVRGTSGQVYPIDKVVAVDESGDLMKVVVDIPFFRIRPLRMSEAKPQPGEHIVVIGSPFGLEQTVSDGIVSTVRDADEFGRLIQITAPISSGSSGSPVLNSSGAVIGVATVQLTDGQNLNFAIPSERVIALKPETAISFTQWSASTHEKAALKAAAQGEFQESLDLYQKALVLDPQSAVALDGIGDAYFALGKYLAAINAYQRSADIDAQRPEVHYHLGEAYERTGDWPRSIDSYGQAIRLRPDYGAAFHRLALAYVRAGDQTAAMTSLQSLRRLDPEDARKAEGEMKEIGDGK